MVAMLLLNSKYDIIVVIRLRRIIKIIIIIMVFNISIKMVVIDNDLFILNTFDVISTLNNRHHIVRNRFALTFNENLHHVIT